MVYTLTMRGAMLVRERDLGDHEDSGPRPLPAPDRLLRWGRPILLPLSSAMRVVTTEKVLALSYDDGPHPEHTGEILAELAARGIRATFFVLTDAAERHPDLVRAMVAAGHEIGLHGVDHTMLTQVRWWQAARAVLTGRRRLERITGRRVRLYRPTYGAQGLAQFLAARLAGMEVAYWTVWARDWEDAPAPEVAARAVRASHPGAVILLHDVTEDTMDGARAAGSPAALPTFSRGEVTALVLDGLLAEGYRVDTVGHLLATHPVVRAVTTHRPWRALRR
ncbi:MAG: polysaccharide deacetylase family protein [Kineosporiaceae bacterium]|nr:polysaccharide deacetylase family protein [Kineosporiaceae bacterium]